MSKATCSYEQTCWSSLNFRAWKCSKHNLRGSGLGLRLLWELNSLTLYLPYKICKSLKPFTVFTAPSAVWIDWHATTIKWMEIKLVFKQRESSAFLCATSLELSTLGARGSFFVVVFMAKLLENKKPSDTQGSVERNFYVSLNESELLKVTSKLFYEKFIPRNETPGNAL